MKNVTCHSVFAVVCNLDNVLRRVSITEINPNIANYDILITLETNSGEELSIINSELFVIIHSKENLDFAH